MDKLLCMVPADSGILLIAKTKMSFHFVKTGEEHSKYILLNWRNHYEKIKYVWWFDLCFYLTGS